MCKMRKRICCDFEILIEKWSSLNSEMLFVIFQLVNYILNAQHGKRIAVILNECGEEIGVERVMINEGDDGGLEKIKKALLERMVCELIENLSSLLR